MTLDLPVPDIPVNSTRLTAAILRPRDDMPASQDIRVRGASGGQPPNRGPRADRGYLRTGRGPAPVAARDRNADVPSSLSPTICWLVPRCGGGSSNTEWHVLYEVRLFLLER